MIKLTNQFSACAIAVAALLSACGGGGTTPSAENTNTNTSTSGATGTCAAAPCINFSETTAALIGFAGMESSATVVSDPADSANKVAKLIKKQADAAWAGATVHLGATDQTVTRIDPTKGISLRVYAAAAGQIVGVKIESGSTPSVFQEATATTTKANAWETLTFAYPNASASETYNKLSVFPAFQTKTDTVLYIDELKYTAIGGGTSTPASNLVTNGDFSNGTTGWSGNAANARTEGTSSFNFADVTAAGNPWDVTLQSVLNIPASDVRYKLSFKAWSDRSRTLVAGIGLNQDPWTSQTQTVNLTTSPQTFDLSLTSNFASATSRILFDMGAAVGQVLIDDVILVLDTSPAPAAGPTAAASGPPTTLVTNVKSIFSDSYTNVTVDEWGPDWGPTSARIVDGTVAGNGFKTINMSSSGQEFAGISFTNSKFDATTYTTFNLNYWIDTPLLTGQALTIKLSNHDGSGETSAIQYVVPSVTGGGWQTLSIPLSSFTQAATSLSRNNIAQVVITAARADTSKPVKVHFDNLFFSK